MRLIHATKIDKMKRKLVQQKNKISEERNKWQGKLDVLNDELSTVSDRAHRQKSRGRKLIQDQIDKATISSNIMQNYIDELEDKNKAQSQELKQILKDKRAAVRSTRKAKAFAEQRLQKWHTK